MASLHIKFTSRIEPPKKHLPTNDEIRLVPKPRPGLRKRKYPVALTNDPH